VRPIVREAALATDIGLEHDLLVRAQLRHRSGGVRVEIVDVVPLLQRDRIVGVNVAAVTMLT
jgi:hypothetical protein